MARQGGYQGPGPAALAALALMVAVMLLAQVAAAPVHGTHRSEHLKDTHKLVRLAAKMRFAQEGNATNATDAGAAAQNTTTSGSGAAPASNATQSATNATQSGTNTTTPTGATGGNTTTPTAPTGTGNATSNATAGATAAGNATVAGNSTASANTTSVAGNATADANSTATTAGNSTATAANSTVTANGTDVAGGANATNTTVAVQSASSSASGSSSVTPITTQAQQQAQQPTKSYVTPTYTGVDESKPRLHCPDNVDCSGPHHWTTDRARLLFSNIYAPAGSNKFVPKYKKAIVHIPDPEVANRHQVDVRPGKVKKEQNAYGVVDETQGPSQESSKEYVEPLFGFSKDVSCLETDSC